MALNVNNQFLTSEVYAVLNYWAYFLLGASARVRNVNRRQIITFDLTTGQI